MQIDIQARGFKLTEATRTYCDRRLRFALGSMVGDVHSVTIRLADQNGPRGGIDTRCSIRVTLRDGPLVIILQEDTDLYVAIDRAVDRASRTAARRLDKTLSNRRAPDPLPGDEQGGDARDSNS